MAEFTDGELDRINDALFSPTKFKVVIPRIERIVDAYDEDTAGEQFLADLTLDDLEFIGRPWPEREDPDAPDD